MKRLGTVLHRSGVKNLIIIGDEVKPDNVSGSLPKLNSVVVDKALNRIGTIVSVFRTCKPSIFFSEGL